MLSWTDTPLAINQLDVSFVRGHKLFGNLSVRQFESLLDVSQAVELERGEALYAKNQCAEHFFVLITGQIKLTRTSISGNEKVIDIINPGRVFAEAALLTDHQVYSEDTWAIRKTRLIAIRTDTYFSYLKESPELCLDVMEQISRHVQWLIDEIDQITLHDAVYRLIGYLLEELGSSDQCPTEFRLNTPKAIIASRLSITPETLSRVLKKLANQNLIDYQNCGVIYLKDIPKLRELISADAPPSFCG